MTLIKSLLLGSAAGIVAVASAQAADLPTKKGAPAAEYVKVCTITANGKPITGFVIPGSDTCLKISGYVSAQYTLGTTATNYTYGGGVLTRNATTGQDTWGMFDRGQVNFEAVSNTAYGPLYSIIELQGNYGKGFDSAASGAVINHAYLTWAGLTAGKHGSFYDYLAGGYAWDDIISPDHSGGPIPLIAYTASFGGGFSATISAEQNANLSNGILPGYGYGLLGSRAPDFIASVDLSQGWGGAHLAGVAHDSHVTAGTFTGDKWGYGIIGGLTFNLPSLGAGDDVKLQATYARDAINYVGINSIGGYNLSGITGDIASGAPDIAYLGGGAWSDSTAYSLAAIGDFNVGSTFSIHPEISYGHVSYSGSPTTFSPNMSLWVGGGVIEWVPVKNLVFDLDLLYETGNQAAPIAWAGVGPNSWKSHFDGFNGKLRIERDF